MSKNFDIEKCKEFVNKVFDQKVIPGISQFIQIPNTSKDYDPEWATNGLLEKAALHIKSYVDSLQIKGAKCQMIKHQGYTPILFTQIQGDIKDRTIFFYGHFDKQPHMLNSGWDANKGPTKAVIENGKLYGRGGADDGYSTYCSMLAIKTCQQQGIPIPRCVMLTEGDEESGGHIDYYIEVMRERIGNPEIIFCLDSGTYDYQRLWITTSLRGMVDGVLEIQNIKEGVHSGDSSGIVPNVHRIADLVIQKIQNLQTGKICEDFWVDIPPNRYEQSLKLAKLIGAGKVRQFALLQGVQTCSNNALELILNRTWRPQLTVTGITGLNPVKSAGNVMIPQIKLRLSLRLPPTFNKKLALQRFQKILTQNPPFGAHVKVLDMSCGQGWNAPDMSSWLHEALKESSQIYYGNEMGGLGQGGSIPLMGLLSQMWPKAQFVITGVLGPASNAHGPNQFLHIDYTKKITQCMAHVLSKAHTV